MTVSETYQLELEVRRLKNIIMEIKSLFNTEYYDETAPEDSVDTCFKIRGLLTSFGDKNKI